MADRSAVERWSATARRRAIAEAVVPADGAAMSTNDFDAQQLQIPGNLRRRVESASLATASKMAQIGDGDLRPAVIAIDRDELVLVTRRDTRRWKVADLERVDGRQIVPREGAPVAIGSWREPERRAVFLRAVRELLGQPEPAPEALVVPAEEVEASWGAAKIVGAVLVVFACLFVAFVLYAAMVIHNCDGNCIGG
jgi:hypothetical protein